MVLDCIFKKFRVCLNVQCLHHPVFVKCNSAGLYVDRVRHLFHRQALRQQLKDFTLPFGNAFLRAERLSLIQKERYRFLNNQRGEIRCSLVDLTDSKQEFVPGGLFEHISGSAATECLGGHICCHGHGQKDQLDPGRFVLHLCTCVESIQVRHIDVEDDDVRLELGCRSNQTPTVRNNADHLKFRFQ